ncbi:hypothetical protein RHSIM_Rhsim01G0188200 [Rhododendron simsii]|uniref:Uncharacterized protein n=1 Tax=Rhododendron simsii TaxID=118357 RepID=A0A834LWW0_RHOSS|nr:hypothetical protein RHSIM_Rhsim01G0188200 [Rhododendron simsii]
MKELGELKHFFGRYSQTAKPTLQSHPSGHRIACAVRSDRRTRKQPSFRLLLKPFIVADLETVLVESQNDDDYHVPYAAGLLPVHPGEDVIEGDGEDKESELQSDRLSRVGSSSLTRRETQGKASDGEALAAVTSRPKRRSFSKKKPYRRVSYPLVHTLFCFLLLLPFSTVAQTNGTVDVGASITAGDNSTTPWLSASQDFAFGFKQLQYNNLFLLSIWYYKIPDQTIV